MNCIAAVDLNFGIGNNNDLLFHIPEDLQFFREKTDGKIVVMGKNTLLSLPFQKPFKNRTNIVLSATLMRSDCIICKDTDELFKLLSTYKSDDIFVIGGEEIYKLLLPYCSTAYITKIYAEKFATRFFPNIDKLESWELKSKSEKHNYNGIEFSFCEYRNKNIKTPVGFN